VAKNYRLIINSFKVGLFFILCSLLIIIFVTSKEEEAVLQNSSSSVASLKKNGEEKLHPEEANVVVESLSFSSLTNNKEPYNILAKQGVKTEQGDYYLLNVAANLELQSGQLSVNARDGKFKSNNDILELNKNVVLKFNDYLVNSEEVIINLYSNNFIAKDNVVAQKDNIKIKAEKLEADKDNQKLLFHGKVKSIIDLNN